MGMADKNPQTQDKTGASPPASPQQQDHYAVLKKVIDDVTQDRAMLRKLVYALARQSLKPEVIVAKPIPEAQSQAATIVELEQALQLERAIKRIEGEAITTELGEAVSPPKDHSKNHPKDTPKNHGAVHAEPTSTGNAQASNPVKAIDPDAAVAPIPLSTAAPKSASKSVPKPTSSDARSSDDLAPPSAPSHSEEKQHVEHDPELDALDASFDPPLARGELVAMPEPQPRPERNDVVHLERIPPWLDPRVRVALDAVDYAPIREPAQQRSKFFTFSQLVATSAIGVVLYIGISGWVYMGWHGANAPAPVLAPRQQSAADQQPVESNTPAGNSVPANNSAQAPATRSQPEPQPTLPFPLPRSYGVYAGVPGQLFELEQLPIKVPDPRVQVSAEITKPSGVTTPDGKLSFVVFRKDLPQSAVVRVIARVQRVTKYVDGKPTVVPVEGIWRIRSKAFEMKVSPFEGRNEMVVIQPDPGFIFPPGRYALVLNGFGYDFTVAGQIVAPEQCLEQVELVNGSALTECPKM